jgi:hypothetical protein
MVFIESERRIFLELSRKLLTNINLKEINKSTKLTLGEVTTYVMRDETP